MNLSTLWHRLMLRAPLRIARRTAGFGGLRIYRTPDLEPWPAWSVELRNLGWERLELRRWHALLWTRGEWRGTLRLCVFSSPFLLGVHAFTDEDGERHACAGTAGLVYAELILPAPRITEADLVELPAAPGRVYLPPHPDADIHEGIADHVKGRKNWAYRLYLRAQLRDLIDQWGEETT